MYIFCVRFCTLYNKHESLKQHTICSYNVQSVLYIVQFLNENSILFVHCTIFCCQFCVLYNNSLKMYVHFIVHIWFRVGIVHFSGVRNPHFHWRLVSRQEPGLVDRWITIHIDYKRAGLEPPRHDRKRATKTGTLTVLHIDRGITTGSITQWVPEVLNFLRDGIWW